MSPATRLAAVLLLGGLVSPASAQTNPLPNCPADFRGQPENASLTCLCRPGSLAEGTVWGSDVYTADSQLCRAARHAGLVPEEGGPVTVQAAPGRESYRASSRNGVSTEEYGAYDASFRLRAAAAPSATPQSCPDNFTLYRGVAEPLRCLCPGEATTQGQVWGVDVYTDDSGICRAAVHAGAIPATGGAVTVQAMSGRASYPGGRRYGVESSRYDAWEGSFSFPGAAGGAMGKAALASAAPVQAPVAETLKARGQVQLYISFRTGSADLDISAAELLGQLRDALRADAGLRLLLVGHTDSTGNAAQNRPLSLRRAESVRAWLVAQGIEAGRLGVDGKGPDQPIADNATDAGRALNRRVAALRQGG